jgi:hypothetical protein
MPVILTCGHSICEGCYKRAFYSGKNVITCPFDNKEIGIKEDCTYNH